MGFRTFAFLLFAAFSAAQPGFVTTVIGTGIAGSVGDGGSGKNAQLNSPSGVSVDKAGNIYVADSANSKIRRLLAADTMQTVATCGPQPGCIDVVVDPNNNFYFSDGGSNRIRKVTNPNLVLTTLAGTSAGFSGDGGPAVDAKLDNPIGVAWDTAGNLYFSDLNNQRVRKISPAGIITTVAGKGTAGYSGDGGQAINSELNSPHGLGVDGLGNLYIADTNNYRIRKVTPAGIITTVAGNGTVPFPSDIGDNGLATNAGLVPWDVEVDEAGNLYISDWLGHRIRKVSAANGVIGTVAGTGVAGFGGDNGPGTSAKVNNPTGLALDSLGNIYFVDSGNHRIRKIEAPPQGPPVIRTTNPVVPSFLGNAGFSSNMYVEIYGSNFARSSRIWTGSDFTGANAPTKLNGISVTVNGKPAYVYYASPAQININVPDDPVTGSVGIQVQTPEGFSNIVTVNRSRLSPTMLTTPTFKIGTKQYVVALTPDFASYIGRPNMIAGVNFVAPKPGDIVSIYALGLGPTTPETQAGVAAAQNSTVAGQLHVTIGGVEAAVPFKGLLQGTIGLYQLNVTIPNVSAGDQKIELSVDGVSNNQDLTIVVGP
jgi:uncharacterized protein (TIGR03437 family)